MMLLDTRYSGKALALLRIVSGLLFMEHGTSKLFNFPPFPMALPPMGSLLWFGGVLEMVGGFLLVVGALTRPAAFILSGEMAIAYWMFHAPKSTFPAVNMGDAAILYCFIFLYLAAAGPGEWALDNARTRKIVERHDDHDHDHDHDRGREDEPESIH